MSFEKSVLELAIKELFNDSHFSICAVDKIGKLIGVNPRQHPNYKYLHALHCVDYADMEPEILNELQTRVAQCFRPQFDPSQIAHFLTMEGNDFTHTEDETFPKLIN